MAMNDVQPDRYLVFEADQVLTNKHLNQLFYYLDQQNRWTRNKLIGIGIACGLEIVLKPGIIEITKGCGVTSQGYLILHGPKQYTYYLPYSAVEKPEHLPFDYPAGKPSLPFYKEYCDAIGPVFRLLDDDEYNGLEPAKKAQAKTISSATAAKLLDDYVVVLFLEADEIALKNCDVLDCNNEGERMMLHVRPLLIRKKDLPDAVAKTEAAGLNKRAAPKAAAPVKLTAPEVALHRFNVPYAPLRSTDDIIAAFAKITDDATLNSIAAAYQFCYDRYKGVVKVSGNSFTGLADTLIKQRKEILIKQPWLIQYFYDFIDDLVKAYLEFRAKMNTLQTACCPDENKFPLHLVLGEATAATSSIDRDGYRTYFIYSPLFARQEAEIGEAEMLFRRMVLLVQEFNLMGQQSQQAPVTSQLMAMRQQREPEIIKITPSRYELAWLSQRAIPYYYEVAVKGNELYKNWNFYKTAHGNAAFNLSYHSYLYSHADVVINPLLYDIEHSDFFRIEGHIGQPYESVLKNLLQQRLNYNLPFDVVAISSSQLPATDTTKLPECNIEDLETDYKLIVSEFACTVKNIFCNLSKKEYAANDNIITDKVSSPSIKGSFLWSVCPPKGGTIGSEYLSILSKKMSFINPVQPVQQQDEQELLRLSILFSSFEFIDVVEEIMLILRSEFLSNINISALAEKYKKYTDTALNLHVLLSIELRKNKDQKNIPFLGEDITLDMLWDQFSALITTCLDERLKTLKDEYSRRLQQYALQRSFYHYYGKHPGLEHKAGVPKGGTFVLVYHTVVQRQVQTRTEAAGRIATTNIAATAPASEALQSSRYTDNDISLLKSFMDDCADAPPDKKQVVLTLLDNLPFVRPQPDRYRIPAGAVIADFYVPYLCCSDCPPVAYILPAETRPPQEEKVTFSLESKEYVFDDANNYPFIATPPVTNAGKEQGPYAGTNVANPDKLNLWADEDNKLYLHPAMPELDKTLQATVTYKNVSLPVTIIKPNAAFVYKVVTDAAGIKMLQPTAMDSGADTYEWTVNGIDAKIDSKAVPAALAFDKLKEELNARTVKISLTVTYNRNDVISTDTTTQTVKTDVETARKVCVDFEPPIEKNKQYGSGVQNKIGDEMFTTKDNVIVRAQGFLSKPDATPSFDFAQIIAAPAEYPSSKQSLLIRMFSVEFNFSNIGFVPSEVTLEVLDKGGLKNMSVNGGKVLIGDSSMPVNQIDGVSVSALFPANSSAGTITLKGKLNKFMIGSEKDFVINKVCASQ